MPSSLAATSAPSLQVSKYGTFFCLGSRQTVICLPAPPALPAAAGCVEDVCDCFCSQPMSSASATIRMVLFITPQCKSFPPARREARVEQDRRDRRPAHHDVEPFVLLPLAANELLGFVDEQQPEDRADDVPAAAEDAGAA